PFAVPQIAQADVRPSSRKCLPYDVDGAVSPARDARFNIRRRLLAQSHPSAPLVVLPRHGIDVPVAALLLGPDQPRLVRAVGHHLGSPQILGRTPHRDEPCPLAALIPAEIQLLAPIVEALPGGP